MDGSYEFYRSAAVARIPDRELMQLVDLANSGDMDSMDRITRSVIPIAIKIVNRISRQNGYQKDNMLCEAVIAVPKAVKQYDSSKEIPFLAFCAMKMEWAVKEVIRVDRKRKAKCVDTISLGEVFDDLAFVRDSHVDRVIASLTASEIVENLPLRQAGVIKRYYGIGCEPKPESEIARDMGMSDSWANLARHGALKFMREQLERKAAK